MNKEQIDAIESLNNTLLIAGAGSGKTTTIINKINYLINNNIFKDNEILVLSFTNVSANDIKRKLNKDVDVLTFHKLALRIINDDIKIVDGDLLVYIIEEYFNGFGKYNDKTRLRIKRLLYFYDVESIKNTIFTFINLYKTKYNDIYFLFNCYKKEWFIIKDYLKIILDIFLIYKYELESFKGLDFNDLISYSTELITNKKRVVYYKYIIIDEFQDTSLVRLKLILEIVKQTNAKVFFVGDDYQSIYRFSGCDLNVFFNIKEFIPDINIKKLKYNYRNNENLIKIANKFILKNKYHIYKSVTCIKNCEKPIVIVYYVNKKTVFTRFIKKYKNDNFLVLGRNNYDKTNFNIVESNNVNYLTVHKSKGLEADNVIIINLEDNIDGFPSKKTDNYILKKISNQDRFLYEEERRLFYVAITRSKNITYLFVPINNPSIFVKELIKENKNYITINYDMIK